VETEANAASIATSLGKVSKLVRQGAMNTRSALIAVVESYSYVKFSLVFHVSIHLIDIDSTLLPEI
jgi:hypothetical protein